MGGVNGRTDGGSAEQNVRGHIGGKSVALLQPAASVRLCIGSHKTAMRDLSKTIRALPR